MVSGATGWHGKHLAMLVRCQQQKALWCEQSQAPQAASQHLQMALEQGVHLQMALELALQRSPLATLLRCQRQKALEQGVQ